MNYSGVIYLHHSIQIPLNDVQMDCLYKESMFLCGNSLLDMKKPFGLPLAGLAFFQLNYLSPKFVVNLGDFVTKWEKQSVNKT